MNYKKTILVDLDGVLNNYTGEYQPDYIPEIKDGAREFLYDLSKKYSVKIFTSRNTEIVSDWIIKNGLNAYTDGITNKKEAAWLIIDDRCIKFDGNFENLMGKIEKFKTWYK